MNSGEQPVMQRQLALTSFSHCQNGQPQGKEPASKLAAITDIQVDSQGSDTSQGQLASLVSIPQGHLDSQGHVARPEGHQASQVSTDENIELMKDILKGSIFLP